MQKQQILKIAGDVWDREDEIFSKADFLSLLSLAIDKEEEKGWVPKSETYAEAVVRTDMENLQRVGFTKDQAGLLLEIIQKKALSGGLF